MSKRKWILFLISLFVLISFAACSPKDQAREEMNGPEEPLYRETHYPSRTGAKRTNEHINGHEAAGGGGQNEIGYFRYNPANYHTANGGNTGPNVYIDRPLLSKHIAQLVTVLPDVKESTVLVTDDHVFVGIKTKDGKHNPKTTKEAKRTAESITPRYFKVHVTDSQKLESRINNIGMRMRTNHDVEGVRGDLEQLLRNMGDDTPPDMNENSNPNSTNQIGY
jgi:Sporulation lipoprotein YhcN/YlaJ (Spore_YhcN_YlaJ)